MTTAPQANSGGARQFHPLAELFPLIEGTEFDELVADIKAHGQREWILTYEGKILDGRNRLRACLAAGIKPSVMEDDGRVAAAGGPEAYVVSANLHRRHLNAEQKRDVIAKLLKAQPEKSDRQIAKQVNVHNETVGAVRTSLEARDGFRHVETRTDTKGRKQPAKKAAKFADEPPAKEHPDFDEPDEVIDLVELVEEVLDGEPLTAKQAATFEKIKKRLQRHAREKAKQEAAFAEMIREYKSTLGPFVARLMAAGVAREFWQALTVRGPCGGKVGYALWLVPPLVKAIEEALEQRGDAEVTATAKAPEVPAEAVEAPPKRGRGRPPGSKNKPKSPPAENTAAPPQRGEDNAPSPEASAEIMKAKMAALDDDGSDPGPLPERLRRTA